MEICLELPQLSDRTTDHNTPPPPLKEKSYTHI